MSEPTKCPKSISVTLNIDHIVAIKKANEILHQSDEQVATGVIVSFIEGSWAGRSLSLWSWAYAIPPRDKVVRLNISLTDGQDRRLEEIRLKIGIGKTNLIRWIVAETAAHTGMMFVPAK